MLYPPEFKAGELVELKRTYIAKEMRWEKGQNWFATVLEDFYPHSGAKSVRILDNGKQYLMHVDYLQHHEMNDEKT